MSDSGQLKKLQIVSFSKPEQDPDSEIATFDVLYNPSTFQASYTVKYNEEEAEGQTLRNMKYSGYDPTTYSFELFFDGTGASVPHSVNKEDYIETEATETKKAVLKPVADMVKNFMDKVYGYQGDIHRPSYLHVQWGKTATIKCVLTSVSVTYDLFKPNGDPLRAKLACSFKEYSWEDLTKAKENKQSPDVTHLRTVQQGDKLPLMCERIYGDAMLYLEVAKANGLTNYRKLTPGQKLIFPPLLNNS